uniref:Cadherin domain-containing protein n=1 Tax=Hucho hucho TaxID=62062 RepID=A0A4W5R2U1_9TELE
MFVPLPPGGTVIGSVKAMDRDLPATGVRYSLISGGGTGGLSNIFSLDPKLGSLTLLTRPDYETTQTYSLVIRAEDGDTISPLIATTMVTIDITEANDEPPLCGPNRTDIIVPKDLRTGSNIQGFIMTCSDRDSPSASFIYSISGDSNLNNHFVFSPSSGTNVTRLFLKEPFDYESGLDRVWQYSLTVLVSDGNLRSARSEPRGLTQTGTVIINILVVDPDLTTVTTTTIPRVTYITITENTYSIDHWYIWFVIALGTMLLLGLLSYLLYHLCGKLYKALKHGDCSCCEPRPREDKEVLIPEPTPPKREIFMVRVYLQSGYSLATVCVKVPLCSRTSIQLLVTVLSIYTLSLFQEVTKINTVFDGEEVDPGKFL